MHRGQTAVFEERGRVGRVELVAAAEQVQSLRFLLMLRLKLNVRIR